MWDDLFAALALVMVIEGLLPAIIPSRYRTMMVQMASLPETSLRTTGLISMIAGAVLLYFIKH